jgi:hypothetical protein
MQKVEQCRSNCREQLNSKFFAQLSTRFSILKIDHFIMRIGIKATYLKTPGIKKAPKALFVVKNQNQQVAK